MPTVTLHRASSEKIHYMECTQRWVTSVPSNVEGILRPKMFPPLTSPTINTKAKNIELYTAGVYGNTLPQWDTVDEIYAAGHDCDTLVMVRCRMPSGSCTANVRVGNAGHMRNYLARQDKLPNEQYYFSQQLPDQERHLVIQGEVAEIIGHGFVFRWSKKKAFMRDAMATDQHHAFGEKAKALIRLACYNGRRMIYRLLDHYPGHVIEFTVMNEPFGSLGWRTILWEIRGGY